MRKAKEVGNHILSKNSLVRTAIQTKKSLKVKDRELVHTLYYILHMQLCIYVIYSFVIYLVMHM